MRDKKNKGFIYTQKKNFSIGICCRFTITANRFYDSDYLVEILSVVDSTEKALVCMCEAIDKLKGTSLCSILTHMRLQIAKHFRDTCYSSKQSPLTSSFGFTPPSKQGIGQRESNTRLEFTGLNQSIDFISKGSVEAEFKYQNSVSSPKSFYGKTSSGC